MPEEQDRAISGPSMICATTAIKTGPARIGHIAGNFSLPRTVEVPTAIAVVIGAVLGLLLASMVPAGGAQKWVFGLAFGGGAGWFAMTFSPLKGESLLTWAGLQVKTLRNQRMVDGKPVVIAVGSAVVDRQTLGRVRLVRAAVRVPAGRYDDRGVLIIDGNGNTADGDTRTPGIHGVRQAASGQFVTTSGPAPATNPPSEYAAPPAATTAPLETAPAPAPARQGDPDTGDSPATNPSRVRYPRSAGARTDPQPTPTASGPEPGEGFTPHVPGTPGTRLRPTNRTPSQPSRKTGLFPGRRK